MNIQPIEQVQLERYPKTNDRSLQAWSNAELLALSYIENREANHIHLFNDRFGVWNCCIRNSELTTIWTYASQQRAIRENLKNNGISPDIVLKTPLDTLENVDLALIKVPKSLELFELFLAQIHRGSTANTEAVCCFMTKYFSKSMLRIAEKYFSDVSQSKAWKKARLLFLKSPKVASDKQITAFVKPVSDILGGLQQYYGVFSSGGVDIGTQFLMDEFSLNTSEIDQPLRALDLACGNGILGKFLRAKSDSIAVTYVDDFNLATASAALNDSGESSEFICANTLEELPDNQFDLVISNPPFHFEHENNIEVSISLFKGVERCLKPTGRFVLVANKHLNYQTHLTTIFSKVRNIAQNHKFEIYECS